MRLMVFSDIHGNLEALQSVLKDSEKQNIHRHICLGDLVGYGPFPNECVELVKNLKKCRCIAGNHDVAALWETSPYGMSKSAKEAILWTMEQLTDTNKDFLANLPDRIDLSDMSFVHANPYNPRGWHYVLDRKYAMRSFAATHCKYLFIGHSHRPLIISRKNFLSVTVKSIHGSEKILPDEKKRHIINCGSVGQPRDDDPRASYLVFDTLKQEIELHRVIYDSSVTVAALQKTDLPSSLYKRLIKGT